jgi:ribosome-binding protein aMBF1 (putative translation factor)
LRTMNTSLDTALLDVVRAAREQSGFTAEEIQERLKVLKEYLREAGHRLNKAIAHSVRELRKRRGLSQEQFARGLNEHPDLTNESYQQLLAEIRRAEAGLGIGMVTLMYIGLRFAGPSYTGGTLGCIDEAQAFVAKIFRDGRAGGIDRLMTN